MSKLKYQGDKELRLGKFWAIGTQTDSNLSPYKLREEREVSWTMCQSIHTSLGSDRWEREVWIQVSAHCGCCKL